MDAIPTPLEQLQAELAASGLGDAEIERRSIELGAPVTVRTLYALRRAKPDEGPQPSGRTMNRVWMVLRMAALSGAA